MNNDKTPDQPSPVQLDRHALALWDKLRAAIAAEQDWLVLHLELQRLSAQVEATGRRHQPALIGAFRAVTTCFRDLTENWNEQRGLMTLAIQELAWDFTTYAFHLRFEDRVQIDDEAPLSMSAIRLLCASSRFADLTLEGRLLKKDGSEDKASWSISLLRTPWCKIEAPQPTRRRK